MVLHFYPDRDDDSTRMVERGEVDLAFVRIMASVKREGSAADTHTDVTYGKTL